MVHLFILCFFYGVGLFIYVSVLRRPLCPLQVVCGRQYLLSQQRMQFRVFLQVSLYRLQCFG